MAVRLQQAWWRILAGVAIALGATACHAGTSGPTAFVSPRCQPHDGFVDCSALLPTLVLHNNQLEATAAPELNGVALADVDGDGRTDMFVWSFVDRSHLLLNRGGMQFAESTDVPPTVPLDITGASFGDLDGDGDPDLVLTAGLSEAGSAAFGGEHTVHTVVRVWRNDGGKFTDVSDAWGFGSFMSTDGSIMTVGADLVDINGDGLLDVYLHRQLGYQAAAWLLISGPGPMWHLNKTLLPDQGDQWASNWVDLNGDGQLDVVVINKDDGQGNGPTPRVFMYQDGSYTETMVPWTEHLENAMGANVADLDGDGKDDLYITSIGPQFTISPAPLGDNVAQAWGLDVPKTPEGENTVGYSVALWDFDADGLVDLYLGCSTDKGNPQNPYSHLFHNLGSAQFQEENDRLFWSGTSSEECLAIGDLDNDGRPDLVMGGNGQAPRVLWNRVAGGTALSIRLRGCAGSPGGTQGIGALVTLDSASHSQRRWNYPGGNPCGYSDALVFFGLGSDTEATATVRWLDGTQQQQPVHAGQNVITESCGAMP